MNPLAPPFSVIVPRSMVRRARRERRVVGVKPAACGIHAHRNWLRACGGRCQRHHTPERQCYPECSHSTSNPTVVCSQLRRVLLPRHRPRLRAGRPAQQLFTARSAERRLPLPGAWLQTPTSRRARPRARRGRRLSSRRRPARRERPRTPAERATRVHQGESLPSFPDPVPPMRTAVAHSPAVSQGLSLALQSADQPGQPDHFCLASTASAVLQFRFFLSRQSETDAGQAIFLSHRGPPERRSPSFHCGAVARAGRGRRALFSSDSHRPGRPLERARHDRAVAGFECRAAGRERQLSRGNRSTRRAGRLAADRGQSVGRPRGGRSGREPRDGTPPCDRAIAGDGRIRRASDSRRCSRARSVRRTPCSAS